MTIQSLKFFIKKNIFEIFNCMFIDIVKAMYYACTHDYYFTDNYGKYIDAWCMLFSFDDLKVKHI